MFQNLLPKVYEFPIFNLRYLMFVKENNQKFLYSIKHVKSAEGNWTIFPEKQIHEIKLKKKL